MLDGYELGERLGKGSFGRVWKATRKFDGKVVAIKEIDYTDMSTKQRQMLVNEVNILRKLQSPYVVKYIDRRIDKEKRLVNIVMEYCPGGDLQNVIRETRASNSSISEDQIWVCLSELLVALVECHAGDEKILHRDIKPGNVFIDGEGNVKLGDFGLARELKDGLASTCAGTPYYMSPELNSGKGYNEKSDIWALGCVCYEMAALKPPFQATNSEQLKIRINTGKLQRIPSKYSDSLWLLIQSMLDKEPSKRPSAENLLASKNVSLTLRLLDLRSERKKLKIESEKLTKKYSTLIQHSDYLCKLERKLKKDENVTENLQFQIKL